MAKKRTINEFRQVKGFGYRPPHSHRERLDERKTVSFTKEELKDFTEGFLDELIGDWKTPPQDTSIEDYIDEYFG